MSVLISDHINTKPDSNKRRIRQRRAFQIAVSGVKQAKTQNDRLLAAFTFTQTAGHKTQVGKLGIHARLGSRMRSAMRVYGLPKSAKTNDLLGCSPDQFRDWLESQFKPGMSWVNYGDWHIDHIRPCCSFDLSDPLQQIQCFRYTNLQPLWAADNIAKSGSYNPPCKSGKLIAEWSRFIWTVA